MKGRTIMAKVKFKGLEKFTKQLKKLSEEQISQFSEAAIKELAAQLLEKVVKRTPVYQKIPNDVNAHTGGTLRRGWTIGEVVRDGSTYKIDIINSNEYASYVEYGHRGIYVPEVGKTLHLEKWTPGKFMLTISEQELQADAPGMLENKLKKFLGEVFK
jgi:mRNA-degrading endonuclease RelE of RelBE toxin-antitoxin system